MRPPATRFRAVNAQIARDSGLRSWQQPADAYVYLSALAVAAPALAQSTDNQAIPGEIVVTGAALPQASGEAAYDTATIDRARLAGTASGALEDALRDVAGLAQYRRSDSRSAQPTSQGVTLRGLGGNASSRALVTLDGVPLVDPFGGWVSFDAIDPARLGLVRVTRGGGSGANGPGALAGTIALESANATQLPPVWAGALYGSRDSVEARGGVAGALGSGFAFLSAHYARGDGFIPIVKQDRGPIDEAAPYRQASVSGRAVFPIGGDAEVQASGLVFTDKRTRGTPFTPNSTQGEDASLRLVSRGRWGVEALTYVQARTFSAGFASINAARTTATETLDQYDVPSTGLGGKFELRPPTGDRLQLRLGIDTRYVTGETDELYLYTAGVPANRRAAGGRSLTIGAFGEASYQPADGLTLTAGGRIDRWRIMDGFLNQQVIATGRPAAGNVGAYPDRAGWRPTGRGGAAWKPGNGAVTIRAAAYLGWRLPTLNELYRPYRVGNDSTLANPLLKPERLRGVDGGVDYDPLPTLHLAATVFTNRLEDAIGNVTTAIAASGARTLTRENLDAVTSKGVELDARLTLGTWMVSASYAHTDAHVRSGGAAAALDGLRPAQTAPDTASATLGWTARGRGPALSATLRYTGPQFEDDLNTEILRRAVTLDATALVPVTHGVSIELRGENVTNTRVDAGISGADIVERATPRTLWIGLRFQGGRS